MMPQQPPLMIEEHTNKVIREAEAAKARILPPQGKPLEFQEFTSQIDNDYLVIGNHVDENTQLKISKGEYIDFSKLIPRDKVLNEGDTRLELIVRNGRTFWAPVTEAVTINNFAKWEQAFRIFSNVYNSYHPEKVCELIQYNHIIHTIALTFAWDNVYAYDKEFCMHISKHPERSWSIILQQAWSMKLKDRLVRQEHHQHSFNSSSNNNYTHHSNGQQAQPSPTGGKSADACHRFNRGRCKFGPKYHYDHKCSYCGKFGHSVLNCCKLVVDKE